MRKRKKLFFLLLISVFLYGCGRGQESIVVIGRSGEEVVSGKHAAVDAYAAEGTEATKEAEEQPEALLYVYVCGAVNHPGVVVLEQGSRVEDALEAAGGFSETADRNYVNLAARVADGEQLYFPTEEEALVPEGQNRTAGSGLVNINTADAALLCTLPGIGESRAQDIIAYREENGGFQTEEDIMKVSGIKTGAYNKIRDKITVK